MSDDRPHTIEPSDFPWLDTSRYSFSLGVEGGGASWLAGQTASAYDAEVGRVVVDGSPGEQAALAWDKVARVIEAAGRPIGDCSEVVEYVTPSGLSHRDAIAAARPPEIGGGAVSTVVVESLVRPEAVVEIEVVAGRANGLVKVPQVLPVDDDGAVVAPGDFVAQCAWVLEEAGRRLAEHGLGLDDVVKVVQQTTPATRRQYGETATARRELLAPAYPASTGVMVSALPRPDVLVALDVWASAEPKRVAPYATDAYAPLTFSPAVAAGGLLFVSGTTAWDPATNETVSPDDIAAQAEFVYDQIRQVCDAAGTSIDRVVKTVEYVAPAGLDRYREVGPIREAVLGRPLPASTGVVVAGLLGRTWMIEVEAVAVL